MFDKLISRKCEFDPKVDLHPVDQFGYINLREAYDKGVISGEVSFTDESFNGMLPDDVMSRPRDKFERIRQADYVKSALKAASAKSADQSNEGSN